MYTKVTYAVITKRWALAIAALLLLCTSIPFAAFAKASADATTANGFLHRQDTTIVDGNGKRVYLRGVNLGNWLLWENWLMGSSTQTTAGQTAILQKLGTLVGTAQANQFESDVYANYITAADMQRIGQLGFNVVRVPINYRILEDDSNPGVYKASGWQILDNVVNWAQQNGIYVVLDMHAAPGAQNPFFIADSKDGKADLWSDPSDQARTVNLWEAIAARYASNPTVAAYDLLNEPRAVDGPTLDGFYEQLASAVRAVDPNHMIMVEGTNYSADTSMFTNRFDDNMLIGYHQYLWGTATPEQDLTNVENTAKQLDIPLWVGEFGLDSAQNITNRINRFNGDPLISGWADWTWKASALTGFRSGQHQPNAFTPTSSWQKTINWLSGTLFAAKPTVAQATQGMKDYLTLIKSAQPDAAVTAALQTGAAAASPVIGTGTGLTGTYYKDANFGTAALTRTDPSINFNWGYGAPASGMPVNNLTVRWQGYVQPQYSETYQFTTTADDKVRVWINGTLVIDDWVVNGVHSKTGSIALQAGQKYAIQIDYAEVNLGAQIKLQWQSPSTPRVIVPTTQLYTN